MLNTTHKHKGKIMLEVYFIKYIPNNGWIAVIDGKPVIVTSLADADPFHTPIEVKLIRQKFNLLEITETHLLKDPQFETIKD